MIPGCAHKDRNTIAKRVLLAALLCVPIIGVCVGQDGLPRFETSSIRTNDPNKLVMTNPDTPIVLAGAAYRNPATPLQFLIAFAYDVKNPALTVVGLPKWAMQTSYNINAKAGSEFAGLSPEENQKTVKLMLQAMLRDRFHLKIHTEERETKILDLQVAKGGLKIRAVDAPKPPAKEGRMSLAAGDRGGRIIAEKATFRGLASSLTVFFKQPVVDKTGLEGFYDFKATWEVSSEEGVPVPAPGLGSDGLGLLVSNLEQKFGLSLRSGVGKIKYWVIDGVEMPDEN